MWLTFIIAFGVFLVAVLALAAGLLISGKAIKGSCGGLGCKLCKGKTDLCRRSQKPIIG